MKSSLVIIHNNPLKMTYLKAKLDSKKHQFSTCNIFKMTIYELIITFCLKIRIGILKFVESITFNN